MEYYSVAQKKEIVPFAAKGWTYRILSLVR